MNEERYRNLLPCLFLLSVISCSDGNVESGFTAVSEENMASEIVRNEPDASQSIIFRYEIKNTSDRLLDNVQVSVAIPVADSVRHNIERLDANIDGHIKTDSLGNQKYIMELQSLPPFSSKILTVKVKLTNTSPLHLDTAGNLSLFLAETEAVPFKMAEFSEPIQLVKGATDLDTARNAYLWVIKHMHYTGYLPNEYGALYALEKARGDCTEYMYLLATILRGNGIPARLVAGYVYAQSLIAVAADYHNWVEAYIDGEWRVVDAQKEHFMGNDKDYIEMAYLDSLTLHRGQKFSASDDVVVKMF
ncbi:transglutaminase-like domain-containing protein [Shewanella sp. AS16]|uniref:transglutaminase-like domain-containing protein n=1 Tax=Shewanella sp. AS16 TaxID=2907625 RepID=UPI001F397094|nr:transglutaminase-like domain-containing protein [Shewanella sp. AS16]MCE9686254.1 transglutaminase-like domain-containing protein [Shewanella sp. AS16]